MRIQHVAVVVLGTAIAAGQAQQSPAQPQKKVEFEVASIRPSAPITSPNVTAGVHIDGAQVTCILLSLRDYIRAAYKVKDYQIIGPDWMAGARFDITAKVPEGTTQEQTGEMLKSLLASRFGMTFHRETRELPVLALVTAKGGAKLKESPKDAEAEDATKRPVNVVAQSNGNSTVVDMGGGASFSVGNNKLEAKKVALPVLAETLASFNDKPILDMTGLTGLYDIALEFMPDDFRALMIRAAVVRGAVLPPEVLKLLDNTSGGDAIGVALEPLGLKLEPRKASVEVLVIDHMEQMPTDN